MHPSLTLSSTTLAHSPTTRAKHRTLELSWPQTLSVIVMVVLRFLVFASIVLWPWEIAD